MFLLFTYTIMHFIVLGFVCFDGNMMEFFRMQVGLESHFFFRGPESAESPPTSWPNFLSFQRGLIFYALKLKVSSFDSLTLWPRKSLRS